MLILLALIAMELKPGAGAPEFKQPQLAARGNQVALTYGAGTTIYFASSSDGGRTFAPAVAVANEPGLMLGRHRGPRVSIVPQALVISAVGAKGNLDVWRSTDGGKTWSPQRPINDAPRSADEGLHAMAADTNGVLFSAWLDHRHPQPGKELYGARSTDGGLSWSKNLLLYQSPDGTICQCCDPSLAFDEHGTLFVMWRNAVAGNRDMYTMQSSDGTHFSAAQKMGKGTWPLDACPMDGGGLVVDHGRLISAWRRETSLYLAEPGKPETLIGTGKDVGVAAGKKGVYAIWTGPHGVQAKIPGKDAPASISAEGTFPNLVALPDGSILAAWEEKTAIRLERLP